MLHLTEIFRIYHLEYYRPEVFLYHALRGWGVKFKTLKPEIFIFQTAGYTETIVQIKMEYPASFFQSSVRRVFDAKDGEYPKDRAKASIAGGPLPTLFLTARDYPKAKGAKDYTTEGLDAFIARYCALPPAQRTHYEMMLDTYPCKLYFDLDLDPVLFPDYDMERVIARLPGMVGEALGIETPPTIRMDCNRAEKTSTHLLFPTITFRNACDHMRNFVAGLVLDEEMDEAVDMSVYSKDRCFRLYGSHKAGDEHLLLRPGEKGDLDPAFLRESLCSVIDPDAEIRECGKPKRKWEGPPRLFADEYRNRVEVEVTRMIREMDEEVALLNDIEIPKRRLTVRSRDNKLDFQIAPGMPCAHAERMHRSNTTFFTYYLYTGEGHFQCTDPECRAGNLRGKYWAKNYRDDVWKIQEYLPRSTSSPPGQDGGQGGQNSTDPPCAPASKRACL
jgi:hypothetical protein